MIDTKELERLSKAATPVRWRHDADAERIVRIANAVTRHANSIGERTKEAAHGVLIAISDILGPIP